MIDRAYILHDGRVLKEGTPAEIVSDRDVRRVYLGREILAVGALMAGVGQRLEMRQGQSLVMTPQLQQAIKLLQLSNIELAEYCEAELEKNPLLERDESAPRDAERETVERESRLANAPTNPWRARISPRSRTWTRPRMTICMTATTPRPAGGRRRSPAR